MPLLHDTTSFTGRGRNAPAPLPNMGKTILHPIDTMRDRRPISLSSLGRSFELPPASRAHLMQPTPPAPSQTAQPHKRRHRRNRRKRPRQDKRRSRRCRTSQNRRRRDPKRRSHQPHQRKRRRRRQHRNQQPSPPPQVPQRPTAGARARGHLASSPGATPTLRRQATPPRYPTSTFSTTFSTNSTSPITVTPTWTPTTNTSAPNWRQCQTRLPCRTNRRRTLRPCLDPTRTSGAEPGGTSSTP